MRVRSFLRGAVSFAALAAIAGGASATITQVDGEILPQTCNMFNFFHAHGEEAAATTCNNNAGPFNVATDISPVSDAAEAPTQFLPDTASVVTFEDIGEGAGFENSFGWYNVGDDVQTGSGRIQNLHVVLGVNDNMVNQPFNPADNTQHYGDPTEYVKSAEEGSTITVDFAKEKTAGRYKGGFISFYLITPEGSPAGDNNGDYTIGSAGDGGGAGKSKLGKIYFTDKDLNNDGDFVHYLIYPSKAKAKSFIFGFEDLFRGGDNDFEDMLIRVTGLTPPCIPTTEVCDGLDNDCDGNIDENVPTMPGVGSSCLCDSAADCENGPQKGVCENGTTVCKNGAITCDSTTTATAEKCDGVDNNCNGQVDDNPTDVGSACGSNSTGACKLGHTICVGGTVECTGIVGPTPEICDGIDNNCNGQTDEGNPGGGGACGSSVGTCTPGTLTCTGGTLVCTGGTGPTTEKCDGLDNNCNGIVDDNPTDVGSACGSNSTGACKLGTTICVSGTVQCAGSIGPSPETCNNIDDDCDGTVDDNPVDVGQPCGQSTGVCTPGRTVCSNGAIVCQGGTGPGSEICDGLDNDCDGIVDEDVPGVGSACGAQGSGACAAGIEKCINGSLQCVGGTGSGTEVCNGIDDDCDGKIDEGDLCNGGVCDHGVCAAPCVMSEFPCPPGKKCDANNFCVDDPCYGINCPPDMDGNAQSCQGATCQPICNDPANQCTAPFVCRGKDGSCVPNNCDYLPLCGSDEICVNSACTTDPCAGVTCPDNQFCSNGTCQASCQNVQCDDNQQCLNGQCVATGCPATCPDGYVCDPTSSQCVKNTCADTFCGPNQACNPLNNQCVPDPCQGVACPNGQACGDGIDGSGNLVAQCGTGQHGQYVSAAGAGCDASGGGDTGGLALVGAVLLALVLRRKRALWLPLLATASLTTAGCKLNDYCIDCEAGDGGVNTHDGGNTGSDGSVNPGSDGGINCDPANVHQETCNGADDDCDGLIDEGFNTQTDPLNCGRCGVQCNKPGAQTTCNNGACVITGCFPGFVDADGDTTGPYASSDGCEYACFTSNNGVEACDNLDNDCDGKIDEGIDVSHDINNCGMCGRVCQFFEATATCSGSACSFDPATDCAPGFFDIDHLQADGCEYQCTPTNGGVESCDLVDNDCDGVVDNGFNTQTDPNNCGQCGHSCSFPHVNNPTCSAGKCAFNPTTQCAPGFVDADGNPLDGCEYQCTPTNGGVEKCDGKDNDCDGKIDETPSDAGGACSDVTPPKGACQANGVFTCAGGRLVCTGATGPSAETCNNVDDDCDGTVDDGVVRNCYDGPANTQGKGACKGGTQTCSAGTFPVACSGEVTPTTELCNGIDDDCDGTIDNGPGSGVITATCYDGSAGTAGVGTCKNGTKTCQFGAFGTCVGEVVPTTDVCGDNLDTDCDGKNDAAEGCLVEDAEFRLDGNDAAAGALGTAAGAQHSHDVSVAVGGNPRGTHLYTAWNELVGGKTQVYLRVSKDGGKTWGTIVNVTNGVANNNVEPVIAVQPSGTAGGDDTVVIAYQNVGTSLVRDIFVQKSVNSGATWGAATAALDGAVDAFHQAVAISGSTVVVSWEALDTTTLNRDIQSKTSTDGGSTFTGAVMTINSSKTATTRFAGRPQVGITSGGGVVWAWREQRSGATRDIFAAATSSATTAPTTDVRVDKDSTDTRDSDFPVMVVAGNAAYLAWQDPSTLANGGSNISFSFTTNGGTSWANPSIIDDPAGEVSASFSPTLAVDPKTAGSQADDIVMLAWEDRREGTQVFASVSKNGASTFGGAIRASNEGGQPVDGIVSIPSLASAGSGVWIVSWQNQANQAANDHVFVASSIDDGTSWQFTQAQLDGGAGNAVGPHTVGALFNGTKPAGVTSWTDFRTNHIDGDIYAEASHN